MQTTAFSVSASEAAALLGGPSWPQFVDVRLAIDYDADPRDLPGSVHRDEATFDVWVGDLDPLRPILVSCHRGLKVSQAIVARMRARGLPASSLGGGFVGWREHGLPLTDRAALHAVGWRSGSRWVTRRRPKIDRVACPWLVTRFIDPDAEFLYVEPDQVTAVAERTGGIPYDIEGVAISHVGGECSFDTLLRIAGLAGWPPLHRLAAIVRGADNGRPDLAPEAAGLLAASLGLSHLAGDDDRRMARDAFVIYDGLYAWAAHAAAETHNWPPKT